MEKIEVHWPKSRNPVYISGFLTIICLLAFADVVFARLHTGLFSELGSLGFGSVLFGLIVFTLICFGRFVSSYRNYKDPVKVLSADQYAFSLPVDPKKDKYFIVPWGEIAEIKKTNIEWSAGGPPVHYETLHVILNPASAYSFPDSIKGHVRYTAKEIYFPEPTLDMPLDTLIDELNKLRTPDD